MFVNYLFANEESELPPMRSYLYEYVVGANGVFVRAKRKHLEAMIPAIRTHHTIIRGLQVLKPYVKIENQVPGSALDRILGRMLILRKTECLFYLFPGEQPNEKPWMIYYPEQNAGSAHVRPIDVNNDYYSRTLVEIHSHNEMSSFFSVTDDKDETGFRIYAVVGGIADPVPQISVRVGIYGHHYGIPASLIFQKGSLKLDDENAVRETGGAYVES